MPRYALRITRFDDQRSFQRVAEFLSALYPERHPEEFEVGLARLPCTVTHDASRRAAEVLRDELAERGARTLLLPLGGSVDQTLDEVDGTSQEVDIAILEVRTPPPRRVTSPRAPRRGIRGIFGKGSEAPPWEES